MNKSVFGGPIYYPLLTGAISINGGNNAAAATIAQVEGVAVANATDEIGQPRIQGKAIDIGAIEMPPPPPKPVLNKANDVGAAYSPNPQMVTLSATVTVSAPYDPSIIVNKGTVTFDIPGVGTTNGQVSDDDASATITIPGGEPVGKYPIYVNYIDTSGDFVDLRNFFATLTITPNNVTPTAPPVYTCYSPTSQTVPLSATIPGLNEGTVTFIVAGIGSVQAPVINGFANASFTLPAGLAPGHYPILVRYYDSRGYFIDSGDTNATLCIGTTPVSLSNQMAQNLGIYLGYLGTLFSPHFPPYAPYGGGNLLTPLGFYLGILDAYLSHGLPPILVGGGIYNTNPLGIYLGILDTLLSQHRPGGIDDLGTLTLLRQELANLDILEGLLSQHLPPGLFFFDYYRYVLHFK